jgi:hypothetical protein
MDESTPAREIAFPLVVDTTSIPNSKASIFFQKVKLRKV